MKVNRGHILIQDLTNGETHLLTGVNTLCGLPDDLGGNDNTSTAKGGELTCIQCQRQALYIKKAIKYD